MESDTTDLTGWIACDYLFLLLREMHYGMDITNNVCDQRGSGNEKSLESKGIRADTNHIKLRWSNPIPSNSLKLGNEAPANHGLTF